MLRKKTAAGDKEKAIGSADAAADDDATDAADGASDATGAVDATADGAASDDAGDTSDAAPDAAGAADTAASDVAGAASDAAASDVAGAASDAAESDTAADDAAGGSAGDADGKKSDKKTETNDEDAEEKKSKAKMELFDWMQCIVSAVVCAIFVFVFFGRTIGVEGHSMLQTLQSNDRVVISNFFYTPKNGDIIIFRPPTDAFNNTPLVKRVIATEGQTIDINFDTGDVFVDGVVQYEPYINAPTYNRLNFTGPVTVPKGHIFVMGDNRNNSADSRDSRVGMVDTRYVLGKVLLLMIPGIDGSTTRDWSRFGLVYR
ncbi:MAG: signal peptidase I [Oscillospiraceae bacterium]|nr:signal peptidase I [Oscillospiraceae bacterium]